MTQFLHIVFHGTSFTAQRQLMSYLMRISPTRSFRSHVSSFHEFCVIFHVFSRLGFVLGTSQNHHHHLSFGYCFPPSPPLPSPPLPSPLPSPSPPPTNPPTTPHHTTPHHTTPHHTTPTPHHTTPHHTTHTHTLPPPPPLPPSLPPPSLPPSLPTPQHNTPPQPLSSPPPPPPPPPPGFCSNCVASAQRQSFCWNPSMETDSGQRAMLRRREGARGRRERRLRAEARTRLQLSRDAVRIASHRGGEGYKAREGEVCEQYHGLRAQKRPLPGTRPAPLSEVAGWQDRVKRHVMEDLGTVCPFVQILDLPLPQVVENVTDTLRILDLPIAEQVMVVPKISCSPCSSRSLIPKPQSADQLVEVPTVLTPLRIAEQIVGTPVPRGRGEGRVQGFLPRQSSTATPSSEERISERIEEQLVDTSPGLGLGQGSSSSAGPADEDFTGVFFAVFPKLKKCEVGFALESESARQWQPIHAGCSAGRRVLAGLPRVGAVQGRQLWQDLPL